MKTINIRLNKDSIARAIKNLKNKKSQLNTMRNAFLNECFKLFVSKANAKLRGTSIGSTIVEGICNSWTIVKHKNGSATISNTYRDYRGQGGKAVFIEFGTGLEGKASPHPNASKVGYQYDVKWRKNPDKSITYGSDGDDWWFNIRSEADIDIEKEDIDSYGYDTSGNLMVNTTGMEGQFFVHNTLVEMATSNELKTLWEEIKKRYWGN